MSARVPARRAAFPLALLFFVGGGWGAAPALIRYAVTGGVPPIGYVFWLGLGAAVICWAICALRRVRPRFGAEHVRYYALSGVSRIVVAGYALYSALQHVPAGLVSVILGTSPLLTLTAMLVLRFERFSVSRLAGMALGLAGIVLIFLPPLTAADGSATVSGQIAWIGVAFLTPVIYAASNIVIDRTRPRGEDSMALTAGMFALVAVTALPLALATGNFHPVWQDGLSLAEAAMFGHAAIIAVCFFGLYELIRMTDAAYGSQTTYITTLTGILYGMALLGEEPHVTVWIAAALILGGVALVNAARRR